MPNEQIRLLFLSPVPLPHSIAIEEGFSHLGYRVKYWYLHQSKSYYPFTDKEMYGRLRTISSDPRNFLSVIKDAKETDLVIIGGWHSIFQVLLSLYCRLRSQKYVYWLDVPEPPKQGIKKAIKTSLLKMSSALFVTGKAGIAKWKESYDIPGIDCFDFPYLENRPSTALVLDHHAAMKERLENGSRIRVLVSSRFLPRKGYDILLAALSDMPDELRSELEVEILGNGPEFPRMQSKYQHLQNVNFRGWVEYSQYLAAMMETDVYIHPSRHEPYGIPPIDAMAMAKVVISSKYVFSCVDRINHEVNGLIFDSNNGSELINLLGWLVENRVALPRIAWSAFLTSAEYGIEYNEASIRAVLRA